MTEPYSVVFICTGNCCRSHMGEALLRHIDGDRFQVYSAGSDPAGFVHPIAIETMKRMGVSTDGQSSKSWRDLPEQEYDIVITVCDQAADKVCPVWPGKSIVTHWGLYDPSFHPGTDEDRLEAAAEVANQLRGWIEQLVALPLDKMTDDEIKAKLDQIPQV